MTEENKKEKNSNLDLEKFAEIILKRDVIRDDRLSGEIAKLTSLVSKLVTITSLSELQHKQHRKERDKTDKTLENHGKRIYEMEKQILKLEITDGYEEKKSDNFDKVKIGMLIIVLSAMMLAYFEMNKKPDTVKHPTPITRPIDS